jgi:hypothetical protein
MLVQVVGPGSAAAPSSAYCSGPQRMRCRCIQTPSRQKPRTNEPAYAPMSATPILVNHDAAHRAVADIPLSISFEVKYRYFRLKMH